MKYPEASTLAKAAYKGSGCALKKDFAKLYGCSIRTLTGWFAGERMPEGMQIVMLEQAAKGWRPE